MGKGHGTRKEVLEGRSIRSNVRLPYLGEGGRALEIGLRRVRVVFFE